MKWSREPIEPWAKSENWKQRFWHERNRIQWHWKKLRSCQHIVVPHWTPFYAWSLFFMHHCTEVVFNELTVLHDTSSKASKRPRKENPTKSPKMPPSSATLKFDVRQLQLSPAIWCFTNQRGERVDQLLSFKPGNKYFFCYLGRMLHYRFSNFTQKNQNPNTLSCSKQPTRRRWTSLPPSMSLAFQ